MTDEKYVYTQDVRDKKITARSASNKRTHNGKGGSVKLPSDFMSKKELKAMNGPVESFPMNSPMDWKKFKSMPDDLKVLYIKAIRNKYDAPDRYIADMFGIGIAMMAKEVKRLGISAGKTRCGKKKWDKEGFLAWSNGVPVTIASANPVEEAPEAVEAPVARTEETAPSEPVDVTEVETIHVQGEKAAAIPCCGSMNFNCAADEALKAVAALLGGANVHISIAWELCDNG
jgi:hypothetical protein